MKYKVLWHDADDDRGGKPFEVEADSAVEAWHVAVDRIRPWVARFAPIDIECLIDARGEYLHPDAIFGEEG